MIATDLLPKIKMVSPGTLLRRALDDILMAEFGALIVFLDDIKEQEKVLEGGFYIGTNFSPEKLYELAKMDGAIILDESVSRILAANVQLTPDPTFPTNETGMRHRAAERMAKQTGKFVITISRRRRVITLYHKNLKYQINDINYLITRINQTITTLERYKEYLDKMVSRIDGAEFEDRVQLAEVIDLVNKAIEILNLLDEIEPYVIEVGIEGRLASRRLHAISEDVRALAELFIMDYSVQECSDREVYARIEALQSMRLFDNLKIANLLGQNVPSEADMYDIQVRPRGYRLLKQVATIPNGTAQNVVRRFKDIISLSQADAEFLMEVEGIGEKRANTIIEGIKFIRKKALI